MFSIRSTFLPRRGRGLTVTALSALLLLAAGPGALASASSSAPAGNNGHIQIDEYALDGGSGNDPHLACGFSVSFFGFDVGTQQATITVTPVAPTRGGTPLSQSTSWTISQRTSGDQLDQNVVVSPASLETTFAGVTPTQQGYHARVAVDVTGAQGADSKYHTIWIAPCAAITPVGTTTTTTPGTTTTTTPGTTTTTIPGTTTTTTPGTTTTTTPGTTTTTIPGTTTTTTPGTTTTTTPAGTTATPAGTTITPPAGTTATPAGTTITPPAVMPNGTPDSAVLGSGTVTFSKLQRLGGSTNAFVSSSIHVLVGEQIQYKLLVTNQTSASLQVSVIDARCDAGTLAPMGNQTLAAGATLTLFCSHFVGALPQGHHVQNVATAVAMNNAGASTGPMFSAVNALVSKPRFGAKALTAAKTAKAQRAQATFTG